jgi:hypothetical protein
MFIPCIQESITGTYHEPDDFSHNLKQHFQNVSLNIILTTSNSTMATFADDTTAMAIGEAVESSTRKLQSAVKKVAIRTRKWRMKLNESKSVHIDFTNNKIRQQPISINGTKVPYANTPKYFGMTLDAKLRWKEHIKKKTR